MDRPIRIGVTAFGTDGQSSGISTYLRNLLTTLPSADSSAQWELFGYRSERHIYQTRGMKGTWLSDRTRHPALNVGWHSVALPAWCRRKDLDVVFLPAANRRLPWALPCPTVGVVHDLAGFRLPGKYDPLRQCYLKKILPSFVRRLTHIITPSENSKRDVVDLLQVPPSRVTAIPLGVDRERFQSGSTAFAREQIASRLGLTDPFVLYVARLEHPGKNHVRLIQAFSRAKALRWLPHKLVLAGQPWNRVEHIYQAAQQAGVADDVVFTDFVPKDLLPHLYRAADLFVFPSLFEGFGIPVLEAMASGTPVACSQSSSIPEVAGSAAAYFDPYDELHMATTMLDLLADNTVRQRMAQQGVTRSREYSWQSNANRVAHILRQVAAGENAA